MGYQLFVAATKLSVMPACVHRNKIQATKEKEGLLAAIQTKKENSQHRKERRTLSGGEREDLLAAKAFISNSIMDQLLFLIKK